MAARDGISKDLAQRFTEALDRSERSFVKTLMEAVQERGVQLTADEIGTTRFVLYKYIREGRLPRFDILVKLVAACGVKFNLVPIKP
jgi:DNA-binding phage protein